MGKAKEQIARTYAELAEALGMRDKFPEPILARLARREDFPGKPGTPGRRDAELPVEQIREWLQTIGRGSASVTDEELATVRRRVALLKLEQAEREAESELGRLADVEEVAKYCAQQIANAKAILTGIADELVGMLPAEIDPTVSAAMHRKIERRITAVLSELARMATGDSDHETLEPSDTTAETADRAGVDAAAESGSGDVDSKPRKTRQRRGSGGDKVRPKRTPVVAGRAKGGRRSRGKTDHDSSKHAGGKNADTDRPPDLPRKKRTRKGARRPA